MTVFRCHPNQKGKQLLPSPEDLKQALTPKTQAIIINSPGNPTGQVYSKEQLQAIADFAVQHNLFVITDEIYENLFTATPEHKHRLPGGGNQETHRSC